MAETWTVVKAGPHWDAVTRTWSYEDRPVPGGAHVTRAQADHLLSKLGPPHSASPDPQEVP